MEVKRVLIVTSALKGAGVGMYILNLCRYLRSVSISFKVLNTHILGEDLDDYFRSEGIEVEWFPLRSMDLLLPNRLASFAKAVRRSDPQVIHANQFHGEIAGIAANILTGIPLVATRHSSGMEFMRRRGWLIRAMRSRYARIISVSDDGVSEAVGMDFPPEIISMIPNGIDTDRFIPLRDAEKKRSKADWLGRLFPGPATGDEIVIGSSAVLKKVKNFPLFFEMASRLVKSRSKDGIQLRFVIIGEGGEREHLEEIIERLGLGDVAALPGFTLEPEKFVPLFDIFVLPSLMEGTPLALVEAMSCGVACVATDAGQVRKIVGDAGIVVEKGVLGELVSAAETILTDPVLRKSLGEKARKRAVKEFNLEHWGEMTARAYEEAMGTG